MRSPSPILAVCFSLSANSALMKPAKKVCLQEKPISSRDYSRNYLEQFYYDDSIELLLITSKYGAKLELMASH